MLTRGELHASSCCLFPSKPGNFLCTYGEVLAAMIKVEIRHVASKGQLKEKARRETLAEMQPDPASLLGACIKTFTPTGFTSV